jgi:hypothetical protein
MFVIRKSSLSEEQYLDGKDKWGPYPKAKRFSTLDAAVKFMLCKHNSCSENNMDAHNASDSGIFPCWRARELWDRRNR